MTADLSPEALAALDALAAAADDGRWEYNDNEAGQVSTWHDGRWFAIFRAVHWNGDTDLIRRNAAYIAAADPSTVRALIAALTEARAEVADLSREVDDKSDIGHAVADAWQASAAAAEARLAAVRAIDPADHATSSRDYGRGYAQAIKDVREAMER